jgi:hypothetical protein
MTPSAATSVLITLSNTQQVIYLKLTNIDYLFWHMQMKSYLIGQRVFSFVDGSTTCPFSHDLSSTASIVSTTFNYGPCQAFFLLGSSKTSSSLVLCCPFYRLKFFISWLIA